jgi:hypothetical protein
MLGETKASGYFIMVGAFTEFFQKIGLALVAVGFVFALASLILAFRSMWGLGAAFSGLSFLIFCALAAYYVLFAHQILGTGYWLLLAILFVHTFCCVRWRLEALRLNP